MTLSFLVSLLASAGILSLAALGALASELAGVLNIGLEAFMLLGAYVTAFACAAGLPVGLAMLLALVLCALIAWITGILKERFDADIFMLGIGLNLLIPGGIAIFSAWQAGNRTVITLSTHGWAMEPGITALLLALVLGLLFQLFLSRTKPGIRLHALSTWPRMLESRGIAVGHYRDMGLVFSGFLAGLAGAFMVVQTGAWVPDMSGGRGWIALVLVYAGNRIPSGVVAAALAYAGAEILALRNQEIFVLPQLGLALPYVLLILLLGLARLVGKLRRPVSPRRGD